MGVAGILAGRLNDRIGPRILIAVAGAALGTGYLLMSYMQTAWQLYLLYGLVVGLGYCTHASSPCPPSCAGLSGGAG
jgi:MFS family permease